MATEKLYWADPFATQFEASHGALRRWGPRWGIVLNKTIFYPEGGGQLPDQGEVFLEADGPGVRIDDVQVDDAGTIFHFGSALDTPQEHPAFAKFFRASSGSAPTAASHEVSLEAPLRGRIDPSRRRDHMAHHTAQHMVSRALVDLAEAETVSARLGAGECTIDVAASALPDAMLHRVEDFVQDILLDDRPIRSFFAEPEEIPRLPLRRAPKVSSGIRIIDVEGFDMSPCGGTHCTRTGQVGCVRIVGATRFKGQMRLTFQAHKRALASVRRRDQLLRDLGREFTCGDEGLRAAVAKLRQELRQRTDSLGSLQKALAVRLAQETLAATPPAPEGTTFLPLHVPEGDMAFARMLAEELCRRSDVVAICSYQDPMTHDTGVVLQRSTQGHFDCGRWFKDACVPKGGRGGGTSLRAEGRLPKSVPWTELMATLR